MTQSAIASLAASFMGALVIANDKAGAEVARYRITSLSDKIGTLKDGTKGEYVILTDESNTSVVMQLHPNSARKLLKAGTWENMVLADPITGGSGLDVGLPAAKPVTPKTIPVVVAAPAAPAAKPAAAPVEAKAPSKKERTVEMFKTMTATGSPRKDIIARMKTELGLSAPGANTYYQNCKSGAWK